MQSADAALTDTLVGVLDQGHHHLNGLLKERQEGALGVSDEVTNDFDGNLLLERQGGGSGNVVPRVLVLLFRVDVFNTTVLGDFVVIIAASNLDLTAANGDFLTDKVLAVLAKGNLEVRLVLLDAGKQTLDDTIEERSKVLDIHLSHGTPEDVGALLETGVTKVKTFLGGTHEGLDVRLVALGASGGGHLTHGVSHAGAQVQFLLAVLDSGELLQEVHRLVEEGQEGVSGRGSQRAKGTGSQALDAEVGVLEDLVQDGHQLTLVRGDFLLIQAVHNSVDGADAGLHDIDGRAVLLTLVLLHGAGQVLEKQGHELLVLGAEILGQIVGQAGDGVQRSLANLGFGVSQELQDHGEDLLHLSADKVGSTLNAHAQGHDTSTTVVGVGVVEVLAKALQEGHNDLAGGQALSEHVEHTKGGSRGGNVILEGGRVTQFGDDLQGTAGELLTKTHALDLELAVLHRLHQEADGLGTGVLIRVSVGSKLVHEDHQVLEVRGQESGIATQQGLENLERLHDAVLLLVVDSLLQDGNHRGDELLESLDGGLVLLRVKVHSKLAQSKKSVDTDLLTFGVTNGVAEEVEELLELGLEALTKSLQDGEEDVSTHNPLVLVTAASGLDEEVGQVSPLTIVQVDLRNGRDDTSHGVTDQGRALAQSRTNELFPDLRLLISLHLHPVFCHQRTGFDGGQLSQVGVLMASRNLDKEDEGLRLVVVLALQDAGGFLDVALRSCR